MTQLLTFAGQAREATDTTYGDSPTLSGLLVPFGVEATPVSGGTWVVAADAAITYDDTVPLLREHDTNGVAAGVLVDAAADTTGVHGTFRILDTTAGRDTVAELRAGYRTDLSVGLEVTDHTTSGGVNTVTAGRLVEVSVVRHGAFAGASVTDLAAGQATPQEEVPPMADQAPEVVPVTAGDLDELRRELIAAMPKTATTTTPRLPTPGEWLQATVARQKDPARFAELSQAYIAAAGETVVGDIAGLLPKMVWGDVLSFRAEDRPVVSAVGTKSVPTTGNSFIRPYIATHLTDAAAATENSDVTADLHVSNIDVTWAFIKRAAKLSVEAITFASPDLLNVALADLAAAYARGTEKVTCDVITAAEGAMNTDITLDADAADVVPELYAGAAVIYGQVGSLPDTLMVAPDVWAVIAGAVDTDGRPLFPYVGPWNAPGTSGGVSDFRLNPLGLQVVVSHQFASGKAYLGVARYLECYEGGSVSLTSQEAGTFTTLVGLGGPFQAKVLEGNAFTQVVISS